MADYEAYRLHLATPLRFTSTGSTGAPSAAGPTLPSREGDEVLLAWSPDGFIADDPDWGPRLADPLPAPFFTGVRPAPEADGPDAAGSAPTGGAAEMQARAATVSDAAPAGAPAMTLEAGEYMFMQWRPGADPDLRPGMGHFIRELWWERSGTEGPWYFRAIREDAKIAFQALRRLASS